MSAIGVDDIEGLIGVEQYEEEGEFPVEQGYVWTTCASVENGNPLFWDAEVADDITGGPIAPPTMVSVWFRPHHWAPGRTGQSLPLQIHFDLKEGLGLPEAVMSDNTIVFHEPVRPGDRLVTRQILRSVSEEKTTRLGTGRLWVIDVATWWPSRATPASATAGQVAHDHRLPLRLGPPSPRRRARGGPAPRARLPGDRHHGGARGPGRPRLATHAPRQGLRRRSQRHP
jgi:acyl dehydratase